MFGMTLGLGGCSKVENKMIGNVVLGVLFLSEATHCGTVLGNS